MEKKLTDAEILLKLMPVIKENANSFALAIGYKRASSIYNITKRGNKMSRNMVDRIIKAFPDVNYLFLTKGNLPILLSNSLSIGQNNILNFDKPKHEDMPSILKDILIEIKGLREDLKK